uniref:Uncharacterized protein n=1 Tax=OCS116 cluster bacterium TaxID=2030921 RepID=A0A2A4Z8M3_9PROT
MISAKLQGQSYEISLIFMMLFLALTNISFAEDAHSNPVSQSDRKGCPRQRFATADLKPVSF